MTERSLLITRSQPGAGRTADKASKMGMASLVSPLCKARYLTPSLNAETVSAIAITSGHGLEGLVRVTEDRSQPVYTVGDQTAALARQAGFENVTSARGDVEALADLIRTSVDSGSGILFPHGERVAGNLAGSLSSSGYAVEACQVYRMEDRLEFSDEALEALSSSQSPLILVHSPAGGVRILKALEQAGFADKAGSFRGVAISAQAAQPLQIMGMTVFKADHPDDVSLLRCARAHLT